MISMNYKIKIIIILFLCSVCNTVEPIEYVCHNSLKKQNGDSYKKDNQNENNNQNDDEYKLNRYNEEVREDTPYNYNELNSHNIDERPKNGKHSKEISMSLKCHKNAPTVAEKDQKKSKINTEQQKSNSKTC